MCPLIPLVPPLSPPCASASLSIQGGELANKALPFSKDWSFVVNYSLPIF